jgi:GT2 family glycosyltransferase
VVLNADAWLDADFLVAALPCFDDPTTGAVQGKLLRHNGRTATGIIDSTGLVIMRNRRVLGRGQGEPDGDHFDISDEVFGPDGAAAIYRRAALDDVALPFGAKNGPEYFDEAFFAYKEDVDLAWRLRLRGWRTAYVPTAKAWHLRTARETSSAGLWTLRRERRELPPAIDALGFANHRLAQLKDDRLTDLLRDILPFATRETLAWGQRFARPGAAVAAIIRITRLSPQMLRKRRLIQSRRAIGNRIRPWLAMDRQRRAIR